MTNIKKLSIDSIPKILSFIKGEDDFLNNFNNLGWNEENIKNHLKKKNNFSIGYFDNNQILGILIAETIKQEVKLDLELYILYVSSKLRRKRIASKLLEYVEKTNDITKISKIYLEVSELNIPAISFYNKNNFVFLNFRHNYYKYKNKFYRAKCFLKKI